MAAGQVEDTERKFANSSQPVSDSRPQLQLVTDTMDRHSKFVVGRGLSIALD
jgi:hypothetical protein